MHRHRKAEAIGSSTQVEIGGGQVRISSGTEAPAEVGLTHTPLVESEVGGPPEQVGLDQVGAGVILSPSRSVHRPVITSVTVDGDSVRM